MVLSAIPSHNSIPDISPELQTILQRIVDDVVGSLSCVGAMVATLEPNNVLPVRAYSVDIAPDLLNHLEKRLNISIIGPRSVAYLDEKRFEENLSVRAVQGRAGWPEKFVVSDQLYDLFRPVVNKPLSDMAQQATGIRQVIAVPFFLQEEVVGNLFAASRTEFTPRDINFLIAFGHQAATAIQSQRRLAEAQALESILFDLQASLTDENRAFKVITDAVVEKLGYLAALVAPRLGNRLPVRAYTVNSHIISQDFIEQWQRRLKVELIGEKAVAYLDRPDYAEQLSIRAIRSGRPQTSDRLYDLVRPVLSRPATDTLQRVLGIKQVIAIPFFLEEEAIGNLYVISQRTDFSDRELEVLKAVGQHAAISIRNSQLYQRSIERRHVEQNLMKMAFSAAAYFHTLQNNLGAFRMYFQMMEEHIPDTEKFRLLSEDVWERLDKSADILDNLHEPWRVQPDVPTDVNSCLRSSIEKIVPDQDTLKSRYELMIHTDLDESLPPVKTSPDLLTEAFRVLVKNGLEALREKIDRIGPGGHLWLISRRKDETTLEVIIRDDGIGIKAKDLPHIFEFAWTTKKEGTGFGLFWTKEYIEGQGGQIRVESVTGEGATFHITLPTYKELSS